MTTYYLPALHYTKVNRNQAVCAFTTNAIRLADMLKTKKGNRIVQFGVEGSEKIGNEFVQVLSADEYNQIKQPDDGRAFYHVGVDRRLGLIRRRTQEYLDNHIESGDFVLSYCGEYTDYNVGRGILVEPAVGYMAAASRHVAARVFPSNAWRHWHMGRASTTFDSWFNAVIPHAYDPAECSPNFATDQQFFLFVGRLVSGKGLSIACRVARELNMPLVVAGARVQPDGEVDSSIDEILEDPIVDYVGIVDVPKRNELMRNARAILVPSMYAEPFGYVQIEAMAHGTPVIASPFGAFPEVIADGRTGFICHTLAEFVQAGRDVSKLPRREIERRAFRNYCIANVARHYHKFFDRLTREWGCVPSLDPLEELQIARGVA